MPEAQQLNELTVAVTRLIELQNQNPSWYEHTDLMSLIIYAACGWIFYKLNRNIDDLYRKHAGVSKDLNELIGAHHAFTSNGTHPCRRKSDTEVNDEPE